MERRYEARLDELRQDAIVDQRVLIDMLPRLELFLEPFLDSLAPGAQHDNLRHYVTGLVSNLEYKNVESIAYLHDQDRQILQKFIGQAPWDHSPLLTELSCQVARDIGQTTGVLVFDPSAFPKKGYASVGVTRQWCNRLGKVDNCQVGVYLGYVSHLEHALVDMRLYLPEEWTLDRQRCKRAGVPRTIRFQTRHELALQMLDERGEMLPHAWVAGDDEMGRSTWFRKELREREEHYLLCVPCNTLVRDLNAPLPPYQGRGRHPQQPWQRVDVWASGQPVAAWQRIDVRDGEKGSLVVEAVRTRVQARTEGRVGTEETLVVFRALQEDGTMKYDYTLAWETAGTGLEEMAWVFKAEHRIEDCLERAKGEAGLGDYEVRTWEGWHHHQALSLMATWFLTKETQRGKKIHTGVDSSAGEMGDRLVVAPGVGVRRPRADLGDDEPPTAAYRRSPALSLQNA
jgi:SRSO17 transposase